MLLAAIEKTIARHRKDEAYVQGNDRMTYAELDHKANKVAADLIRNGLSSGGRVGLRLDAPIDYPPACIGVWRAGGTVVPLDPVLKDSDLSYFVELAQVQLMVTAARADPDPSGIRQLSGHQVTMRHCGGVLNDSSIEDVLILFTSGTTGPPKGIIHTGESAGEMVRRNVSYSGLNSRDVVLATSMFNTGFGLLSYVLEPLFAGARVVIVHPFHPRDALEAAHRESVTWIQTVPAVLQLLMAVEPSPSLPALRTVRLGAATLDDASRMKFHERFGIHPIQGYGMSEIGRIAATTRDPRGAWGQVVGNPEMELRLFEDGEELPPVGELGEIGVRSRSLCRPFYLVRDGSREPLPMHDDYFLTGDFGRLDGDGRLELAGRRKSFILTPRFKVDPLEVEDVLMQHPLVEEAVVLPEPGRAGYETVKAVVAATGPVTSAEILSFCSDRLPSGKCPQIIEFVDRLPRNSLGKVETGKLR